MKYLKITCTQKTKNDGVVRSITWDEISIREITKSVYTRYINSKQHQDDYILLDLGNETHAIVEENLYDFVYRPWRFQRYLIWTHPNGELMDKNIWIPESLGHLLARYAETYKLVSDADSNYFYYLGKNVFVHGNDNFTYTEDNGWCYGGWYDFYKSHIDGLYYFDSSNMPENQDEEYDEEENDRCNEYVDNYHNGSYHTIDFDNAKNQNIRVGLEIEKEDYDVKTSVTISDFKSMYPKWRKESDGSLDDESGYELITPTMTLDVDKIMDYIKSEQTLVEHINADFSYSCGGHINVSDTERTPYVLYDEICGYLPILCALYPRRTEVDYCQMYGKKYMRESGRKYQIVNILSNRLEIRIFPAVRNMKTMEFRLRLVEYMVNNPAKYYADVDVDKILNLTKEYGIHTDAETIKNFLNRADNFAKTIEQD